jgi:hypothetical protein
MSEPASRGCHRPVVINPRSQKPRVVHDGIGSSSRGIPIGRDRISPGRFDADARSVARIIDLPMSGQPPPFQDGKQALLSARILHPFSAIERPAVLGVLRRRTSPLFMKEWDTSGVALVTDGSHPIGKFGVLRPLGSVSTAQAAGHDPQWMPLRSRRPGGPGNGSTDSHLIAAGVRLRWSMRKVQSAFSTLTPNHPHEPAVALPGETGVARSDHTYKISVGKISVGIARQSG